MQRERTHHRQHVPPGDGTVDSSGRYIRGKNPYGALGEQIAASENAAEMRAGMLRKGSDPEAVQRFMERMT